MFDGALVDMSGCQTVRVTVTMTEECSDKAVRSANERRKQRAAMLR
jgi:hypothetical protein